MGSRPGSSGNQKVHGRPNVSAENIRRKVKDSIEGGEELNKMGRTVTDSFIKSNSATNQKIITDSGRAMAN